MFNVLHNTTVSYSAANLGEYSLEVGDLKIIIATKTYSPIVNWRTALRCFLLNVLLVTA